MPFDFDSRQIRFSSAKGPPRSGEVTVSFPSAITKAEALIKGIDIQFSQVDRFFFRELVDARVQPFGLDTQTVTVEVIFGLRDSSGFFDDPYEGAVDVVVIVDRV